MKRLLALTLATLLAIGVLAPAAGAVTTGTGHVQGLADVGRHFTEWDGDPTDCTKQAENVFARGQGLFLPAPIGPASTDGVYSMHASFFGTFIHQGAPRTTGILHLCGWLSHIGKIPQGTDIGPACGASKGHNGRGQMFFDGGGGINIFDLGWKTSAGGTLPVTAKYQAFNGSQGGKTKLAKWGNLAAQVQAQSSQQRCLEAKNCPTPKTAPSFTPGCGSQTFVVLATFELVHVGDSKHDVVRLNDAPGTCKSDTDPTCLYDEKWNDKEPIPGKTT